MFWLELLGQRIQLVELVTSNSLVEGMQRAPQIPDLNSPDWWFLCSCCLAAKLELWWVSPRSVALAGHCDASFISSPPSSLGSLFSCFVLCCHTKWLYVYLSVYLYTHTHTHTGIRFCSVFVLRVAEQNFRVRGDQLHIEAFSRGSQSHLQLWECLIALHSSLISRPIGTPVILLPEHLHIPVWHFIQCALHCSHWHVAELEHTSDNSIQSQFKLLLSKRISWS